MTQPEALRLADALTEAAGDYWQFDKNLGYGAAAELLRLSEIETLYLAAMRGRHAMSEELLAVIVQRDALLEALREIVDAADGTGWDQLDASFTKARAAIKAVEETK